MLEIPQRIADWFFSEVHIFSNKKVGFGIFLSCLAVISGLSKLNGLFCTLSKLYIAKLCCHQSLPITNVMVVLGTWCHNVAWHHNIINLLCHTCYGQYTYCVIHVMANIKCFTVVLLTSRPILWATTQTKKNLCRFPICALSVEKLAG